VGKVVRDRDDLAVRLGSATIRLHPQVAAQLVVHFEIDAPKVVTADTEFQGTSFVASFAPRSRVRAGDQVEVVVDTGRMHFFDPETGGAIRD
jgi:multiple sugar transport system ATP-binding protein